VREGPGRILLSLWSVEAEVVKLLLTTEVDDED